MLPCFQELTAAAPAHMLTGGRTPTETESVEIQFLDSASSVYRHKLVNVVQVIVDWCEPYGGVAGRDILELGCGEGTMALGMALQHSPSRIIGVDIVDSHRNCLSLAQQNIGIEMLPERLSLQQIQPGQDLSRFGFFDLIYSWSVFEHVDQQHLAHVLATVRNALRPGGIFFMQISPLYYSAFGSHLEPWVPEPWAHLLMQNDTFKGRYYQAPDVSAKTREAWAVYMNNSSSIEERNGGWETYETLNKVTAAHLERLAGEAGLKIVRDYRTTNDHPIPPALADIYNRDVLLTEQIVWLLQRAP